MKPADCHNLFEQLSGQPFAAAGVRPGGLELTQRGLALARLLPGDTVLDVGCGSGVTVEFLMREHAIRAMGIDSSSVMVAQGRANNAALPFLLGDAEALPFAEDSFDVVLLECALSLVGNREAALRECHRVLKPQGRIMVTDLYARNPEAITELRSLPVRSCLRGAFDKAEFFHECSVAGFVPVCFEDHSNLLRDFAVRMVWTYGSLDRFWSPQGTCGSDFGDARRCGVSKSRPGYFLFVGAKAGDPPGPYEEYRTNESS